MKTKEKNLILPSFFKPLFWSYKFSSINPKEHKKTLIISTINYGSWKHWLWIIDSYGKKKLKEIIQEIPKTEFREPALKLICLLLGIKKMKYASRSDYIKSQRNLS